MGFSKNREEKKERNTIIYYFNKIKILMNI